MNKHMAILKRKNVAVTPKVMAVFKNYAWPGNVRELENAIEGALNMISDGEAIDLCHLPNFFYSGNLSVTPQSNVEPAIEITLPPNNPSPSPGVSSVVAALKPADTLNTTAQENEPAPETSRRTSRQEVMEAMKMSNGLMKEAAQRLGISRQLLAYRLKKFKLERSEFE
jgi:arginine utilization regulatory protein